MLTFNYSSDLTNQSTTSKRVFKSIEKNNSIFENETVQQLILDGYAIKKKESGDLISYKPMIHRAQTQIEKKAASIYTTHFIKAQFELKEANPPLELNKNGIYSFGKSIIDVETPVFGFHIIPEEIKLDDKILTVYKVELVNEYSQIVSEQIVLYYSESEKTFKATNMFSEDILR